MERVAFLVEATGERLGCLLNPENLVVRRMAGVYPRRSGGGKLTGVRLSDDPLLYTGGGSTEFAFALLFDVQIAGSSIGTDDVRDLTRPLWNLSENAQRGMQSACPPLVRFVWGKSWNVPGIVTAVAERLEQFGPGGTPGRSWLKMRMTRILQDEAIAEQRTGAAGAAAAVVAGPGVELVHQVPGAGYGGQRLDDVAFQYYGDPSAWRMIAAFNALDDPARMSPGTSLRIPPLSTSGGGR